MVSGLAMSTSGRSQEYKESESRWIQGRGSCQIQRIATPQKDKTILKSKIWLR